MIPPNKIINTRLFATIPYIVTPSHLILSPEMDTCRQLDIAVAEEDYQTAARLRDECKVITMSAR